MYYHIDGSVSEILGNLAVIDCGGVGFAVNTSSHTLSGLKKGERAKLFTYCYIREDAFDIYGFLTLAEKRSFEMLIGVSGVGPKAALSILSSASPEALAMAILGGNEKALTVAPGIGKKIAQRIILELKDKLGKDMADFTSFASPTALAPASGGKLGDAAAALTVLGYSGAEIARALEGLDAEAMELQEIIRHALKKMVK